MKYIRNFFIFLFCILLSTYLIWQIPTVKRFTIEKSIEFVNANADFHIAYQNFSYKDLKDISFENVVIEDQKNKKELLKVQKLQVGVDIFKLFLKKELNIKNLDFVDLIVFIDKNKNIFLNSEEQKNLDYFNSFHVKIENLKFINCSVFYDNNDVVPNTKLFFDQNHFNVSKINSHLENVIFSKKGISGSIKNFAAESGKILFKDLSLEVDYHDGISLKNINLDSNLGKLSGDCEIFNVENLDYTLTLRNLTLYSKKIPLLEKLNSEISLEGSAKGNLHSSCIQKLRLCWNKNIASCSGDVDFDKWTYDFKDISGKFHLRTLGKIIPAEILQKIPCQTGSFDGTLRGEAKKGNIIFNIHSKVGELSSNLDFDNIFSKDLKLNGKVNLKEVSIKDFNISKLNSNHVITFSDEETKIANKITEVYYNDVKVNNIEINLQRDGKSYSGVCNVNDENLKTNLNFKSYDNNIICSGSCDLQGIDRFYKGEDKVNIKNDFNIKVKKDKIRADFNNNFLKIGDIDLNLKILQSNFYKEGKLSQFNIFSDILDFKVYDIPEKGLAFKDIFLQFCENLYNLAENKPIKISKDPNFKIPFYINVKDSNIFQLFHQPIVIDNINIYGDFIHRNGKKFLNLNIDKIENINVKDKELKNFNLYITIGLNEKNKLPILDISCEIDKVIYQDFSTDSILCKVKSKGKDINTNLDLKNDYVKFRWNVKSFFEDGKIIFDLQDEDSQCTLNDWQMEKKGCLKLTNKNISIEDLTFEKNGMLLICNYDLTRQAKKWNDKFFFQIKNIDIENWNEYTKYDIKGVLNGEIKKNYSSLLDINFNLDDLSINNKDFGLLKLMTKYDTKSHVYNYTLVGKKDDKVNLDVSGLFYETNKKINAQCLFNDFDLNVIEIFCDPVCSKLEGFWTGHLNVFGDISRPVFFGDVDMKDGKVLLIPINTEFKTSGHFKGDIDGLNITNLIFKDSVGGDALFNGKIKINFQDFPELYLQGLANDIQVLNTTEKDNTTFYGELFCSGKVQLAGPVNFLTISGNVKNTKRSKIFLNFRNNDVKTYNFIHFRDKNEKITNKHKVSTQLNGIRLDLDTTIDNDPLTLIKIPFSEINIQGDGKLHVLTTFNDDFNFKGKVNIEKGNYLLSLGNIINKKFKIEKGGSVNFLGDVNSATLDIAATEDVILNDSNENIVTLKVITSGLIQDPEIKYDIDLSKSRNVNADIKNKIAVNEDMRNYYFLNLLLFRNFESNSINLGTDVFNFFNRTMKISDEKSNFWINLDSDKLLSKRLFKVDLGFAYDKFEFSKEISNKKQDFKDLIFDNIELLYAINKDSKLYTSVRKNKIKFGLTYLN